jgi:hypothetical protein
LPIMLKTFISCSRRNTIATMTLIATTPRIRAYSTSPAAFSSRKKPTDRMLRDRRINSDTDTEERLMLAR